MIHLCYLVNRVLFMTCHLLPIGSCDIFLAYGQYTVASSLLVSFGATTPLTVQGSVLCGTVRAVPGKIGGSLLEPGSPVKTDLPLNP